MPSRLIRSGLAAALALALAACGHAGPAAPARRRIAVIPKGTTHEYWKSVHAGAVKAARDHDVDIIWKGPIREDDRDEQIKVVESFLASGVDGIVLAPLDNVALVPVLRDAKARNVPVVIIDSAVDWNDDVSFISTDNEKAGGLAAERLGTIMNGQGDVLVLRYEAGSASTMARESGFLTTLAQKFPKIRVVSSNQYGGATTESAYAASENLLSTYRHVQGIFCPNESTTFGMLLALEAAKRAGKVKFVGFDASDKLVEGLRDHELDGLVVQNPFRMGELGVEYLLDALDGKSVDKRVDTGATMATPDNMNDPAVKALLSPDLSKYLD